MTTRWQFLVYWLVLNGTFLAVVFACWWFSERRIDCIEIEQRTESAASRIEMCVVGLGLLVGLWVCSRMPEVNWWAQ